jgi:peroxiredoxin
VGERACMERALFSQPGGALAELVGTAFPVGKAVLPSVRGERVDLGQAAAGTLVLYCFARCAVEQLDGGLTDCFMSHYMELRAMGATVAGVSGEPLEILGGAAAGAGVPFALLGDENLLLVRALGLPTVRAGAGQGYERLILIARGGRVRWVRSPVSSCPIAVTEAVAWLQQQPAGPSSAGQAPPRGGSSDRTVLQHILPARAESAAVPLEGARKALGEVQRQRSELQARAYLAEEHLQALISAPSEHTTGEGPSDIESQLRDLIVWHWKNNTTGLSGPWRHKPWMSHS